MLPALDFEVGSDINHIVKDNEWPNFMLNPSATTHVLWPIKVPPSILKKPIVKPIII
jgi:hypothetical protein